MSKPRQTITIEGHGVSVTGCCGATGCPHAAAQAPDLPRAVADALAAQTDARNAAASGKPRAHDIIRVSIAYCPNACSRSQIADAGIIGAALPTVDPSACSACGACADACREDAVVLDDAGTISAIDMRRCMGCGDCAASCPTGAVTISGRGFRLMLGGKMGRHPRFAEELPGLYAEDQLPSLVARAVRTFRKKKRGHERLGDLVTRLGAAALLEEGDE